MSTRSPKEGKELEALDKLIEGITVDAYDDDEQLWAFRQAFEDDVALPADGFVIGQPVSVIAVGLPAGIQPSDRCRSLFSINGRRLCSYNRSTIPDL